MKALVLASAGALAVVALCADGARAQGCQGGGSGGSTSTASTASTGTTTASAAGARLLTGPGSYAYDALMAQQVQGAYLRQQALATAIKSAKDKAYKAKVQAVARERRQEELYRRSQAKANALAMK